MAKRPKATERSEGVGDRSPPSLKLTSAECMLSPVADGMWLTSLNLRYAQGGTRYARAAMLTGAVTRCDFFRTAAAAAAVTLAPRTSRAADSRIEVVLNASHGTITHDLYGHFVEHLGGVVYDGVWVGERSKIPHDGGIRRALVEHMRRLPRGAIRWPGGCFADSYDWRDGIGPPGARPTRPNFWIDERAMLKRPDGPGKHEPNTFGTNEFLRFCRQVGAPPYLAANVRSLRPHDFQQWVEYCNAPAGRSTLADRRAAAGDREPFGVRFWGVG